MNFSVIRFMTVNCGVVQCSRVYAVQIKRQNGPDLPFPPPLGLENVGYGDSEEGEIQ